MKDVISNSLGFLAALFVLALTMGQIYMCTYTEIEKFYLWFTPIPIAMLAALFVGGIKGNPKNITSSDSRGVPMISLTYGIFGLMLVILYIFTFIALNER